MNILFVLLSLLPLWTLFVFFAGVGMGAGRLPSPTLLLTEWRENRKQVQLTREPNRCQCGHMRSFHENGKSCSGTMREGGKIVNRLCTCHEYISSMQAELVPDIFEYKQLPAASNQKELL